MELQLTQEEVDKALEEDGVCYEEYMINDYETDLPIKISEYENLDNLNLLATIAENVNDMDAINAYVDSQGEMTLEEATEAMGTTAKEATQTIKNRPTKYTQYIYKRIKLRLFKYN